nr:FAD-binding protein [Micromonospora sp. DSM 115978]
MTETLTNWAGNVTFGAGRVHRPETVDELRKLVAGVPKLRTLGTGHSFNRLADTTGDLVSVTALPRQVHIDPAGPLVTVPAGLRYGDLVARLHEAGWALPNLASLPHISVAGACATGTHGSGERNGGLATSVSALRLVTAEGDLVTLDRRTDPDRFPGAVVALGALGVVVDLTLDLVPAFDIRQYVYQDLPREHLDAHHAEILGAGHSVSLFTDWTGPRFNQVWVKRRVDDPGPWRPEPRWYGATLADRPLHPVPGMSAENCTGQLGEPGPWYARLPHFKLEFTPSSGEELQSEYLLHRASLSEALDAVDRVRHLVAPALQISEIRTIAADDLWLSPSYGRDSVAIHFTWVKDPDAVAPALAAVEEGLAPLAARPHWGKLFGVPPADLAARYPRHGDFVELARHFDPAGKFRNDLLDRYFPG